MSSDEEFKKEVRGLWEVYRAYIVREDTLINDRFSRLTVIQGFLITAFGVAAAAFGKTYNELVESCGKGHSYQAVRLGEALVCGAFAVLTARTGMRSAEHVRVALEAAKRALNKLRDDWGRMRNGSFEAAAAEMGVPGLRGAGDESIHDSGHNHVFYLSEHLASIWKWVFWVALVLMVVCAAWGVWIIFSSQCDAPSASSGLFIC